MTNIDTLIENHKWQDVNLLLRKGEYEERYVEWAKVVVMSYESS